MGLFGRKKENGEPSKVANAFAERDKVVITSDNDLADRVATFGRFTYTDKPKDKTDESTQLSGPKNVAELLAEKKSAKEKPSESPVRSEDVSDVVKRFEANIKNKNLTAAVTGVAKNNEKLSAEELAEIDARLGAIKDQRRNKDLLTEYKGPINDIKASQAAMEEAEKYAASFRNQGFLGQLDKKDIAPAKAEKVSDEEEIKQLEILNRIVSSRTNVGVGKSSEGSSEKTDEENKDENNDED